MSGRGPLGVGRAAAVHDVLLLVDLFDDFAHEDGDALLASFRDRHEGLADVLHWGRRASVPVVFANDNKGVWDGDAAALVARALGGPGGDLLQGLRPEGGERFVIKPRYSAFDHTPLDLILGELDCRRLLVAGMTTEGCVTQSAIAAREQGLQVTVFAGACATTSPDKERTALRYLRDVVGVVLCHEIASASEQARLQVLSTLTSAHAEISGDVGGA